MSVEETILYCSVFCELHTQLTTLVAEFNITLGKSVLFSQTGVSWLRWYHRVLKTFTYKEAHPAKWLPFAVRLPVTPFVKDLHCFQLLYKIIFVSWFFEYWGAMSGSKWWVRLLGGLHVAGPEETSVQLCWIKLHNEPLEWQMGTIFFSNSSPFTAFPTNQFLTGHPGDHLN